MSGERSLEREVLSRLVDLTGPVDEPGTLLQLLERMRAFRERLERYVDVEDPLPVHGVVPRYEDR